MLRTVIGKETISEIVKVSEAAKRGSLFVKNDATKVASKADGVGVDVFVLDFDAQPTGHLSDSEISQYDETVDTVPANTLALLKKYPVGAQIATDQVDGTFAAGNYAVAKTGAFSPAEAGDVSTFKYAGTYVDGAKTLALFRLVEPTTVA
jgi:hypothetical protein